MTSVLLATASACSCLTQFYCFLVTIDRILCDSLINCIGVGTDCSELFIRQAVLLCIFCSVAESLFAVVLRTCGMPFVLLFMSIVFVDMT